MTNYKKNFLFLTTNNSAVDISDLSTDLLNHPTPEDLSQLASRFNITIDQLIISDLGANALFPTETIKLVILDVDGVLTDGGMYYTESGDEFKKFNTKDGMSIKELAKKGLVEFGIISSGINEKLIKNRAELLGIKHVYVGKDKKLPVLKKWCEKLNMTLKEVAYVGDDINDLEVMEEVAYAACPADAVPSVKLKANHILSLKGGEGCVREFLDRFFPL